MLMWYPISFRLDYLKNARSEISGIGNNGFENVLLKFRNKFRLSRSKNKLSHVSNIHPTAGQLRYSLKAPFNSVTAFNSSPLCKMLI